MPATPPPIRLTGYAPPESTHGQALDLIGAQLSAAFGPDLDLEVAHNILDQGRPIGDLLEDVESGAATLCFFSTSYLAERIPELGIIDLPYVFDSLEDAHRLLDGDLGERLNDATRQCTELEPLGYWDNGYRHLSNKWRDIRQPDDCRGLRVRLQPNWSHEALLRELGAEPVCTDLNDGINMLHAGELDAQENPLGNFVAYGIDRLHAYITMTGHVYGARGLYASRVQLREWDPAAVEILRTAVRKAILFQRRLAVAKEGELRVSLEADGHRITDLTEEEHAAFRRAAGPVLDRAREMFDDQMWSLLEQG